MYGSYAICLLLFFAVLGMSSKMGLRLAKQLNIMAVRSVVQMMLMGVLLEYVFRIENAAYVLIFAGFMSVFATHTANARLDNAYKSLPAGFFGVYIPSLVVLTPLFLIKAIPFEMNAVLPVAGMAVGNSMNAYTLSLDRLKSESALHLESVEGMLALGIPLKNAMADALNASVKAAIMPTMNNIASLGVVLLPGVATGLLIAGVSPVKAIVYQLVIMYMLLCTNMLAAIFACKMFTKKAIMEAATKRSA